MDDVTTPMLSGVVVLLGGLLAFIVVAHGDTEVSTSPESGPPAPETASYSQLDPSVERVLLDSGDAWVYQAETSAGLPEELARVLDAYRTPLIVGGDE